MIQHLGKKLTGQITALILVAAAGVAIANYEMTTELCHGFAPENSMKIPVGFKSLAGTPTGLSEAQFNAIIDRVERIYTPVIAKLGGKLHVNRLWTDATVNASAEQKGSDWLLNMYGGMARHPLMTIEGFSTIICHELGHHLGGAPKIKGFFGFGPPTWATDEGGADYFATLKCARDFYAEDDNAAILGQAKIDGTLNTFAANMCDQQFANDTDRMLCKRGSMGSFACAHVLQELGKTPAVDFTTPDKSKVSKTNDDHPEAQCRLDTYFAGATCDVDKTVALSDTDFRQGSCVENVAKVGFRPRCWFAP